jgi:hypothetical protein
VRDSKSAAGRPQPAGGHRAAPGRKVRHTTSWVRAWPPHRKRLVRKRGCAVDSMALAQESTSSAAMANVGKGRADGKENRRSYGSILSDKVWLVNIVFRHLLPAHV